MKPLIFPILSCLLATGAFAQGVPKDVFPIGGYGAEPQRDKEAGFSIAGPVYGASRDTILQKCEEEQLPCVYTIGLPLHFYSQKEPIHLDFAEVRQEIRRQVEEVMENPLIHAWYLVPEELRYWRQQEMAYLEVVSEVIRETDPRQRPVWMYEPGHRTQEALERTAGFLQIVGKGVYTNYSGRRTERSWVPWTVEQQARAIAAANPEATPYAVLEMYKTPEDSMTPEEIRQWVRHDAYAALVGGVRGIMIFSFGPRPGFSKGSVEWQTYYKAWADVAAELNGERRLGAVFLQGKKVEPPDYKLSEGSATEELPASPSGPELSETVNILTQAAFSHDGKLYWIIVNSSNTPRRLRIAKAEGWKPLLDDQPSIDPDNTNLTLPGLGVAVFLQSKAP